MLLLCPLSCVPRAVCCRPLASSDVCNGRDTCSSAVVASAWPEDVHGCAGSGEKDDIAAQLGVGSAASDAELDRLKDATEAEILARANLIGRFAPLVAAFCHQRQEQRSSIRAHTSHAILVLQHLLMSKARTWCLS